MMSTPLHLPIVKVTVLEDRALVEGRADVTLPAGPHALTVEGLSPPAVDRSLQAQLTGGSVAQARLSRIAKEKMRENAPDKTRLRLRVESLEREYKQAQAEATADEALRQATRRAARTRQQWVEAQAVLAQGEQPEQRLVTSARLEVNHPTGGTVSLRVTYLVPCAVWRPAYRATLLPSEVGESVTLECEAVVWQRTEEDWKNVELLLSTARPTLGASPPRLVEDWLRLRDKSEQEKRSVEVALREEVLQNTGEGGAQRAEELPGLDDGGEALTLRAPHSVTLPSDGAPHRVPLFQFTAPASSELIGSPEHSPPVHPLPPLH